MHCEALSALTVKVYFFWWNQVSKVYEWRPNWNKSIHCAGRIDRPVAPKFRHDDICAKISMEISHPRLDALPCWCAEIFWEPKYFVDLFLASWEIFWPKKNHILWTILPLFQIFPPYWLVWPFSWPFMIHLCRMCAKIFGAIIHLHHWNHQLHHACIIQLHNTPAENFSAKADLLQICWWKCFFFNGEHLLIKFGQKWEVTNCTIADFIL